MTSTSLPVVKTADVIYALQVNPAPFQYESKQQPLASFMPVLWIGECEASWETVGREYLASIEDRQVLDDATRRLAAELTRDCPTNRDKLAKLADYVQHALTYQAIAFGRRAQIPNAAAKTIELKYGDCKDHSLLLQQLLAAVGIPSHLAIVNSAGEITPELPSLDQFDHMVLYVPAAAIDEPDNAVGGLLIDATEKDADPLLAGQYEGIVGRASALLAVLGATVPEDALQVPED